MDLATIGGFTFVFVVAFFAIAIYATGVKTFMFGRQRSPRRAPRAQR